MLARPASLPTGRIPFREPPCPGRQVGEGTALLLMHEAVYQRLPYKAMSASNRPARSASWVKATRSGCAQSGPAPLSCYVT